MKLSAYSVNCAHTSGPLTLLHIYLFI